MKKVNLLLSLLFAFYISHSFATANYNVKKYGARGDGQNIDTQAIQSAIDRCSAKGGGEVVVPRGIYLTSTIFLKNNVTLHLEQDAILQAVLDVDAYQNVDPFIDAVGQSRGSAYIAAVDVRNIAVVGRGIIDGRGFEVNQTKYRTKAKGPRPFLVRIVRCNGVRFDGVTLRNACAWTSHFFESRNIELTNLTVRSRGVANNDGLDIDCSSDVVIRNCDISTGDDAICLKTTATNVPCNNIKVLDCRLSSNCGAIKIGTESMASFENIHISNCYIYNTRLGGIKLFSVDGAKMNNVVISDIKMDSVTVPIMIRLGARLRVFRKESNTIQSIGSIQNVVLRNIEAHTIVQNHEKIPAIGIMMSGIKEHPLSGITLENITISMRGGEHIPDAPLQIKEEIENYPELFMFGNKLPAYGFWGRHINGISLKNVSFNLNESDPRPALFFDDVQGITINKVTTNQKTGLDLRIE